jgi:two-component system, LytTR family, response regulator
MTCDSNKSISVLIVDDETLAREGIRMVLEKDPDISFVHEAKDGKQALQSLRAHKPDVVFMDVQMPEMSGFEALQNANMARLPVVVFVTAYDKYAIEAFEVQAVDYILKPYTLARLGRAIERAKFLVMSEHSRLDARVLAVLRQIAQGSEYITRLAVKSGDSTTFLEVGTVDWISAAENYVELHSGKTRHLIQVTMSRLASRLNPATFVRIHRSLIVNVKRIRSVQPQFHGEYLVTMGGGEQLRSGRTFHETLRRLVSNGF